MSPDLVAEPVVDGASPSQPEPTEYVQRRGTLARAVTAALVGASLIALSRVDYVAFHLVVEVAVVVVLSTIFSLAWHTQRVTTNGYLMLMGMAALPIALVTMLHALTYRGMPVFPGHTSDLPTQMWLVARYLTAAAFLAAPVFAARRLARPGTALIGGLATAAVLVATIFAGIFPAAFVEGRGLTPFKIASEYVIIVAFAIALYLLWQRRQAFARDVFGLLAGSLVVAIISELLFTTYTDVYGITNLLGHLMYLLGFWLLYLALVEAVIERPHEALFRELAAREATLREAHRLSEGLNRIDAAINSTLDADQILQRVVEEASSVLGSDAALVGLFECDRFRPLYFSGYSGTEFDSITLDRDTGRHIFRSLDSGEPLAVSDTALDPSVSAEFVGATGVRAMIANALTMRHRVIGSLGFHWLHEPHVATSAEVDFVRKATASLALALENARLYAGEHEIAEALQTHMTCSVGDVSGVEVGHVYVPAPGPGRLGGDFFDVFALDGQRLAFLLGDVVGHGLAAATTNATTRSIVRALAYLDPSPEKVLDRTGVALSHLLADDAFVTAAFGVLDTTSGETRIAIAGHPDPIIAGRNDLVPASEMRRTPLGVPFDSTCPPWTFTLQPGETVVLFTDGVIETRAGKEFFGPARLRQVIDEAAPTNDSQGIADAVLSAVRAFAGGDVSDDLAVLAITFEGDDSATFRRGA
jgi:hypothetical protein